MINWNDIKNFDITKFDLADLTKVDLSRLDLRTVEMPKFDLAKFDLRTVEMPKFDVPGVEMPEFPVDVDRVAGFARDAAYAGVGAAVVTIQKLDEQRRELTDQVATRVRKLVDAVA